MTKREVAYFFGVKDHSKSKQNKNSVGVNFILLLLMSRVDLFKIFGSSFVSSYCDSELNLEEKRLSGYC